ncbi:hypothetical protein E1H12_08695 [Geitlerinema sp. P-1104]|uniref:hypothetical protein n=1 Tax=Geitlerinema sp. P-1104 TaxID=2546230 RepID=UPI0014774B42|nr:hypothetical protein [Geitlerinema sp. P-1104]NMG58603.1 hypothetical protein [Geitlerinema sp. P-1104]
MSSPPPTPPNRDSLGELSPQQEQQVQRWQKLAAPPSSRTKATPERGIPWGLIALGLGIWAGLLLTAMAAFVLLSHPRYVGEIREEPRDRPSPWMGVVIVVSCTGGSLLLGRWLEIRGRR